MSEDPLISVIVPTFCRFEPLVRTLSDLLAQDYPNFEVIVIDQNPGWSAETSARTEVLRLDRRVRWFTLSRPGVVMARNRAAAVSAGAVSLFVDDDVWIPDPLFLRRHAHAHRDSSIACVCGREVSVGQLDRVTQRPIPPTCSETSPRLGGSALSRLLRFDRSQASPAEVAVFSTCNGSIKREAFDRAGGFDESFCGASYGDDADLALRLAGRGERVVYDPNPWLVHLLAPEGGLRLSDPNSPFSEYDKCLSGLVFAFRHAVPSDAWPVVYGWVLRRSILLRRNILRPWRQPAVTWGLLRAVRDAHRAVKRGPHRRPVQADAFAGPESLDV